MSSYRGDEVAISIGVGEQSFGKAETRRQRSPAFKVALNNKASAPAGWNMRPTTSVTDFVLSAPDDVIQYWLEGLGHKQGQPPVLADLKLVVEDASPDSCFGFLCFLLRLSGVPVEQIPADWIRYVDNFERGYVASGDPTTSYGELHNALVHGSVAEDIGRAWADGLGFLLACLKSGFDPANIDRRSNNEFVSRAFGAIGFEWSNYKAALPYWRKFQLLLPVKDFPHRQVLVDAVLVEEKNYMGTHKAFIRKEKNAAFFGNGFTVLAVYRPESVGDGNDQTISLPAESGLSLAELWEKLEDEENLRWGRGRPQDNPRKVARYAHGSRYTRTSPAPNQPWYMSPDESLIGSPKAVDDGGTFGSKLSWAEVLELLWQTYNPFRQTRAVSGLANASLRRPPQDDELRPMVECVAEIGGSERRTLRIARWHRTDNASLPLFWFPMLGRYLAACIARPKGDHREISFEEIMAQTRFVHGELPGGVFVITLDGAFVVANAGASELDLREITDIFHLAGRGMDWIDEKTAKVSEILEAVKLIMQGKQSGRMSRDLDVYSAISALQLEIVQHRHLLDTGTKDQSSQRFRDELFRFWGVEGRFDDLLRDLEKSKSILVSHSDLVTNRRLAFLTLYGFPIALAATLFSFVFQDIPDQGDFRGILSGIHWMGLAGLGLTVVLGLALVWIVSSKGDRDAKVKSD